MTRLPQPSPALSGAFAFALALLFAAMLAFAPAPAAAQTYSEYQADDCVAGQQSGANFVYRNNCSESVIVAYCAATAGQTCAYSGAYTQVVIGAGSSATAYPPQGTTSLSRSACKARGELYWVDFAPGSGGNSGWRCRANAASAAAQTAKNRHYGAYAGTTWTTRKVQLSHPRTGECTAILNHGALGLDPTGRQFTKERYGSGDLSAIVWSGACDANGLITGSGFLSLYVIGTVDNLLKEYEASADRGILTGNARYFESEDEDDPGEGVRFVAGCNDWNGARDGSCDGARGNTLRQQYLAARGGASPRPAAPKPIVANPATPVAEAPSESAALNAQQNAAAAAWLKADTEARRIQAEKVAEFERKQADFKRQQEDYARQQAEYEAALAAQQAEVARVQKANADAQACYQGDKTRCR